MGPDGGIFLYFSQHPPSAFLQSFGNLLNHLGLGDWLGFFCVLLILYGYFLGKSKHWKAGSVGLLTISLAGIVAQILKHIFGRARPQMNLGEFHFIGLNFAKNGFDSFPSGHATATFAMAAFFSSYYPGGRFFFYGLALAISLIGRVMLRNHFLSDVVAGAILGSLLGFFFAKKFWEMKLVTIADVVRVRYSERAARV